MIIMISCWLSLHIHIVKWIIETTIKIIQGKRDSCFNYLTISDECVLNRIIHLIASILHFTLSGVPQFAWVLSWWIYLPKSTIFSFPFPNFIPAWPLKCKRFGGILRCFLLGDLNCSESFGNGISQVLGKLDGITLCVIVSTWIGFENHKQNNAA